MRKIIILLIFLSTAQVFTQWSQISTISTTQLNAVKFFDAYTGIAAGNGGIWRSTNSGLNWTQVVTGPNFNALSFITNYIGLAVGDSGKIYKTNDIGATWYPQTSGTTNNLYAVQFVTTIEAYAVGQNGIFLSSFSAGTNWSTRYAFNQDLYVVFMLPDESGYAAGASNSEFYTTTANGGTNWLAYLQQSGPSLNSMASVTGLYTYVLVGNNGRIRRTTNSGWNWTLPASNTTYNLYAVTFVDANSGWLCGQFGLIKNSTDSGFNWSTQSTPNGSDLHGISFINNTTGWAVGSNGVVLRTGIPLSITQSSTEIPTQFKLYQNYPNPFNPITAIHFTIPKFQNGSETELITLKIYDAIGSEICVLINRELSFGNYEINFDGTNVSSGVYLYALFVNQKIYEAKKMVLTK